MMAAIRGKNTKPEMVVRRYLHRRGLRFRLHGRNLPGRPDIVLARHRAVVQVHGCFWHQHPGCRYAYMPQQNRDRWASKFETNKARDARHEDQLRKLGWRVLTVWECEVSKENLLADLFVSITAGSRDE